MFFYTIYIEIFLQLAWPPLASAWPPLNKRSGYCPVGDSTKVGSKLTPQYLSETITKLNKKFYYRFRLNRYNF